ncbi:DUF2155 domain-containing protein [Seohaeicola saemankumensis]|nr:DUF2155 domain-containing protein [Seohaeicola saemankumensis]MCA0869918.1 DUF2155 domain-containing protein [Seohaeicola saemankumensis]
MIRSVLLAALLLLPGVASGQDAKAQSGAGALLRALDKVNGATVDVEVRAGETGELFNLDVALADCRFPVDNPTGDAFAYLTIWEKGKVQAIFEGWMIASSPALNALDHSRYDVWVMRCITS